MEICWTPSDDPRLVATRVTLDLSPLAAGDQTFFRMDMIDEMILEAHTMIFASTIEEEINTEELVDGVKETITVPSALVQLRPLTTP